MKLYIIPVGKSCNAKCSFCITNYRKIENKFLKLEALKGILNKNHYEKIEITGGGEPGLHPQLDKIVEICSTSAPTQLYTNGTYLPTKDSSLNLLCISRAHYDNKKNKDIMGLFNTDGEISKIKKPIKFSLTIHKSGISSEKEVLNYLRWANQFSKYVVVRQLFEYENENYMSIYKKEFINTSNFFKNLPYSQENNNRILNINDIKVEIEGRCCACESDNPVLLANGKFKKGWLF